MHLENYPSHNSPTDFTDEPIYSDIKFDLHQIRSGRNVRINSDYKETIAAEIAELPMVEINGIAHVILSVSNWEA